MTLFPSETMASEQTVRQYLAYWFQLGKGVVIHNGTKVWLPARVISGNGYSPEFEACWQYITTTGSSENCYLQGTSQTLAELLSPAWDINPCARCSMPVPLRRPGLPPQVECPCADLPNWPNNEIPIPRSPIDNQSQLSGIRDRLNRRPKEEASPGEAPSAMTTNGTTGTTTNGNESSGNGNNEPSGFVNLSESVL